MKQQAEDVALVTVQLGYFLAAVGPETDHLVVATGGHQFPVRADCHLAGPALVGIFFFPEQGRCGLGIIPAEQAAMVVDRVKSLLVGMERQVADPAGMPLQADPLVTLQVPSL